MKAELNKSESNEYIFKNLNIFLNHFQRAHSELKITFTGVHVLNQLLTDFSQTVHILQYSTKQ